jgi:hypothetical protein
MSTTKLFNGIEIPTIISTTERIFEAHTYDGEIILCNLKIAQELIKAQLCKGIKHYWNHKLTTIGKAEVLSMPLK